MTSAHPGPIRRLRFEVIFHPAAKAEFMALPEHTQVKFERAIDGLATDPFRPRPGLDVKKLGQLEDGSSLHRVRAGKYRACYAVVGTDRKVWILLFDHRGRGYSRIVNTSRLRFFGRP